MTLPMRRFVVLTVAFLLSATVAEARRVPGPWKRTEDRAPCASFDPFRQPFFGETHVHTAYSSDSVFAHTREDPRGAYSFAKGAPIGLPPYDAQGRPTRTARLRRPLDFTAVTDHAEQFGEIRICLTPGLPGYASEECRSAREQLAAPIPPVPSGLPPVPVIRFLLGYGAADPMRFPWCGPDGENCLAQASLVWRDTQDAAEQHYDRTSACSFTTFVAYEWSAQPGGNNLHRNVIFRNHVVPALPTSYMEEQTPEGLWAELTEQCLEGLRGCDFLAIPHNPNVSGGLMFAPEMSDGTPITREYAETRAAFEPVVELTQHKGDSECRPGFGTTDELCAYEKLDRLQLFSPVSNPDQAFPPLNYVRNALREGLVIEQRVGANPFKLGFVGGTDDHNSTPGNVEERDWGRYGHIGARDRHPASILARVAPAGIEGNPGGLAVVWAEENSRDAIFAALRRREVYATSGTRPLLRFFAGRGREVRCGDPNLVPAAYADGVPMGGEIGPVRGDASPFFTVLALRDPGAEGAPSAPLERLQIVKGWVDADGVSHERTYDVAGAAGSASELDMRTCEPPTGGFDSLCAVWRDPDFDPSQRAFYYARLLEAPTCRWSTFVCNDLGLDCSGDMPAEYAECCNPSVPKSIQERAWSSPIWYRPDGLARLDAQLTYGTTARRDVLRARVRLGAWPERYNPANEPLSIELRDANVVYRATLPAGLLRETRPGVWSHADPRGAASGLADVQVQRDPSGGLALRFRTAPRGFPKLVRREHFMELEVRAGARELLRATPLWRSERHGLVARS